MQIEGYVQFCVMLNFNYFQTVKLMRLCHALRAHDNLWRFYGSELLMVISGLVICVGATILMYIWVDEGWLIMVGYWLSDLVALLYVIGAYWLRNIDTEYGMQRECFYIIVLYLLHNVIYLLDILEVKFE